MSIVTIGNKLPSMTNEEIDLAKLAEQQILEKEQSKITTYHTLHGGIYTRTIKLYAGEALSGAIVKIPTTLIISGVVIVYIGGDMIKVDGVQIIPASKNRKQVMVAIKDTSITMMFPTSAKTIEDAENEFTDEADILMSRGSDSINKIIITED